MTAQTAVIRPTSPETLIEFLKLLLKGMLKKLPIKLLIAGGIALLAWIVHTYLLVVTNEGFNAGNSVWLDRILALQGRTIAGTLVWTLAAGLVTSTIARILAYGFGNTIRGVVDTPKYVWQWANELGILAIPFLIAGYFLTILFGFFVNNGLLIAQLLLLVLGILIARHTSILLTILRLGFSDVQKMAKREKTVPFNLAWPGMYLMGVLVGLLAILPSGRILPYVCGCLGFLLLVLVSVGLFVRSQGGTQKVIGKKILFWILPPAFLLLFLAVSPAFADDGGWLESGGTLGGWLQSPGAARAVAMGVLPAAGSGLGVLFGTALGGMISIIGAAGIPGDLLSGRPSATTSPPGSTGTAPPSRTADHQTQPLKQQGQMGADPPASEFDWVEKSPETPLESRTADHQVERFEYQDKADPGELSSRHRPDEAASEGGVGLRSDRAGHDTAADLSRTGEGASEVGTGQRDVRGVQPTQSSDAGPGSGSAAESADRVTGLEQDGPAAQTSGQSLADRHRPDVPETEGPLSDRHRPGGIDEASADAADAKPAAVEQPGLRAERHTPEGPTSGGPTASRHDPGSMADAAEAKPAAVEQPGLSAERHTPGGEEGPLASRHDPDAVEGGGAMRARRAPTEDVGGPTAERFTADEPVTGPLHGRQPAAQEPGLPVPPIPVPAYALNWELVVVRTPDSSGLVVQQRIELGDRTRIGRHGAIDLKLLDPKVSRQHADIEIQGTTCRITDLNSSNGTFVNGRRITEPHELKHGDAIKIGDTYFVLEQRPD